MTTIQTNRKIYIENNTWLLVDMEFLSSCSTRREIPYLRALMYYSLFLTVTISAVKTLETQISLARTARCSEKKNTSKGSSLRTFDEIFCVYFVYSKKFQNKTQSVSMSG